MTHVPPHLARLAGAPARHRADRTERRPDLQIHTVTAGIEADLRTGADLGIRTVDARSADAPTAEERAAGATPALGRPQVPRPQAPVQASIHTQLWMEVPPMRPRRSRRIVRLVRIFRRALGRLVLAR